MYYLVDEADGSGHRKANLGTAPAYSSAQLISFLSHLSICAVDDYATGYDAYPQIYANFIEPSAGKYDGSTSITDKDKQGHDGYTLQDKIDELEDLYKKNGWKVA